jgi:two-component system LytT family response regulator
MTECIRVLVVDDEPIAREGLSQLLRQDPELRVVAECDDGESAVDAILGLKPDLVVLDVQMPELDGFGVIRTVGAGEMPPVIFVTAFDEHAVRAFDVAAVDYVLKPFDNGRLAAAIARGKTRVRNTRARTPWLMQHLLAASAQQFREPVPSEFARRLVIREPNRILFVQVNDIDWIQGADYYSRLHVGGRSYLLRETMTSLARRLDPTRFFRTHRSAIVNLERVREIRLSVRGDGVALLSTGARVRLARGRRELLAEAMAGAGDLQRR